MRVMATDQQDSTRSEWRASVSRPIDVPAFHPMSASIGVEVAGISVCGKTQLQNTDHYVVIRLGRMQETLTTSLATADLPPRFEEYAYAMLVADGLDGDGTGGRASRFALSTLAHLAVRYGKWNVRIGPDMASDIAEQSEFFYRQVADAIIQASRTDASLSGMATSLTALYIAGADLFFAHVGHSRAYLFRNGVLIQLTMDHTLEGLISASAALRRVRLEARRPRAAEPSVADGARQSSRRNECACKRSGDRHRTRPVVAGRSRVAVHQRPDRLPYARIRLPMSWRDNAAQPRMPSGWSTSRLRTAPPTA